MSLPGLTNFLRNTYGCRKDSPSFRIQIKNCKVLCDANYKYEQQGNTGTGLCMVSYEEWQYNGNKEESGRISTVVFRCNMVESQAEGNNGRERNILWLNVHETWIQGKEGILKA